jgi:hypothetical protein
MRDKFLFITSPNHPNWDGYTKQGDELFRL